MASRFASAEKDRALQLEDHDATPVHREQLPVPVRRPGAGRTRRRGGGAGVLIIATNAPAIDGRSERASSQYVLRRTRFWASCSVVDDAKDLNPFRVRLFRYNVLLPALGGGH